MTHKLFLSIIIPVFNESKRLHHLLTIFEYTKKQPFKSEIIIVDDGSSDETLTLLKKYRKKFKFQLLSYKPNFGKGYAIKRGMLKAKGNYCLFLDVDLSTPIKEFKRFQPHLFKYEVIIASRKTKKSKLLTRQSFLREFLGKGFTYLSRTILQVNVSDFTCGFKCFSREATNKIFKNVSINRWGFDAEILFLAKIYDLSLIEIPVSWKNDFQTKVKFPQDIIRSLHDIYQIRINHFIKKIY